MKLHVDEPHVAKKFVICSKRLFMEFSFTELEICIYKNQFYFYDNYKVKKNGKYEIEI